MPPQPPTALLPPALPQLSWPFNQPVDVQRFKDYLNFVKEPMDFGTIKARCESGFYGGPVEMVADVQRVFSNARMYNPPGSDVYTMCNVLQVRAGLQACAALPAEHGAALGALPGARAWCWCTRAAWTWSSSVAEAQRAHLLCCRCALHVFAPAGMGSWRLLCDPAIPVGTNLRPGQTRLPKVMAMLCTDPPSSLLRAPQEAFNDKWSKLVVPRLQEDAKLAQAERQGLRQKRADTLRSSEQQHMSGQCVRLLQEFEELQTAVADLREAAAAACMPLSEQERNALSAALAALPLHQLEGAVAIALARSPHLRDAAHEVGGRGRQEVAGCRLRDADVGALPVPFSRLGSSARQSIHACIAACHMAGQTTVHVSNGCGAAIQSAGFDSHLRP